VKRAVENIFGGMPILVETHDRESLMTAEAEGQDMLVKLRNLLRRERIRNAARTIFIRGKDKESISFCLNKQVAYAGHVSFSEETSESPLGPIRVKIRCARPRELIDWLVAKTT
jgi:predicted RNA binding protein with dsRBD fold (UPF0201 family)